MNLVGIDEVGRGSWAGPLVAAAVMLDKPIDGLKDSKLLSKSQREHFARLIIESGAIVGIGWCDVDTINNDGLTSAVTKAMSDALSKITAEYDEVVIDGSYNFLQNIKNVKVIPKADNLVPAVSAASIVAKVYRDKWMTELSKEFPAYGFEKHVGYGTKEHIEKLKANGPCSLHRVFYKPVKKLLTS